MDWLIIGLHQQT